MTSYIIEIVNWPLKDKKIDHAVQDSGFLMMRKRLQRIVGRPVPYKTLEGQEHKEQGKMTTRWPQTMLQYDLKRKEQCNNMI